MDSNILNLEIFKGVEKDIVEKIILELPIKKFSTGEIIILEGSEANQEGYIIKEGKVKVSIKGKEIAILGKGEIFGEIALLNEEKRTATIEAIEDLEVLVLDLETLINIINNDDNSINKKIIQRIEENLKHNN